MRRSSARFFSWGLIGIAALGITVDILDEAPTQCTEPQGAIWETVASPQLDDPAFAVDPAALAAVEAERMPALPVKPLLARKARSPKTASPSN